MKQNNKATDFIFTVTNAHQIQIFLDKNIDLNIINMKDDKLNNLIHRLAFRNKFGLIKMYIDHQTRYLEKKLGGQEKQKTKKIRAMLQTWINQQNSEGFTPIHYASHKGDLQIIKLLELFGANIIAVNKVGLNVLHMSAQGNRLDPIIYFHQKLNLNSTDSNGMTPLHWAASMGSEQVATFLLAKNVQMNLLNNKQQTPLHLATIYGNTKIVRRLLLKGADRNIKNSQGLKPIEIARRNQFFNIIKMLNDQYSFMDHFRFYCNVQIKYVPQDRSIIMPFIFILAYIFVVGTTHFFIRFKVDNLFLVIPLVYYIVMIVIYLSLIQKPSLYTQELDIYQLINKPAICPECNIIKKNRSYHCQICKICIERYDHHCPWINNCVGKQNITRFIIFLLMLITALGEIIAANGLFLFDQEFTAFRYANLYDTLQFLKIIVKIVSGFNVLISGLFFIPLFPLIFVQLANLFLNKTTYQRFSKGGAKKSEMITDSNISVSDSNITQKQQLLPKDNHNDTTGTCSFRNCAIMCSSHEERTQENR